MGSALGRLRLIGYCEGISFLVLLGVAMPLKYLAEMPRPTQVVGMIHGILWLLYLVAIYQARSAYQWPLRRAAAGMLASVLPFGPFVFDAMLPREAESADKI